MRIVLAVIAALILWVAVMPAAAATGCSGGVTASVDGETVHARSVKTHGMTCRAGKRLIRSFLRKADHQRHCRRASEKDPPTPGCAVGRFHCWRGLATYCARPHHDVSWREAG